MSSKDNKAALKKARECHAQKNYKDTIKICKRIVKDEQDNYGALVLLAAALQEVPDLKSQALQCLKKATQAQAENPVAWRGLVSYYEKENGSASAELVTAYCKFLELDSEGTKFEQYLTNCTDQLLSLKDDKLFEESVSCFRTLYINFEDDSEKIFLLNNSLAKLLTQYPNVTSSCDDLLEKALSSVVSNSQTANRQDFYKRYLKLLYKLKKYELQLQEAAKMHDLYPKNSYPLEWISRTYSEQVILNNKCKDFPITRYHETLLKLNQTSYFALLAKAVDFYVQKSYIACRDILMYIVSTKVLLTAWILLVDVNMKLYSWELAENAALEADQIISNGDDKSSEKRIRLNLIESMIKSNKKSKCEQVLQKFNKFLDTNTPRHLLLLTRAYIILEKSGVDEMIAKLENYPEFKVELTILKGMQMYNQNCLEEAVDVLEGALNSSEAWVLMGEIYLKMGENSHSHMAFLKGVQADPNNWKCLVHLGHYYKNTTADNLQRSKKCYQKALQINPNSDEAGINLSIVYRMLKDEDGNLQLLEQMTADGKGPRWAWLQLGLLKLDQNDPQEAIKCLRIVIRFDPTDSTSWETLADAYFARGAFTSAMKSYQKALELRPESFYSMMQVAHIKLLLSQYEEAQLEYEKVIEKKEDNVVALKGLAETHLGLARNFMNAQRIERASRHIQIAVDYLVSIVTIRSEFSCVWKLLGNACYLMAKVPEKYRSLSIPTGLIKSNVRTEDARVEIKQRDILTLCVRSYCRALNLSRDSPLIWHDLASAYFTQLKEDSSIDSKDAITRCLSAIKHAIRLCSSAWYHWNLLGVICMHENVQNYALAQHSFVTAIELEHNNPVAWTNLATLYLKLDDAYKANEAFSWAQRSDPGYVHSWIGQAIIAEQFAALEAMDIFRHSAQMSFHPQGALGYAHWVIQMLLDPKAKENPHYTYSIVNMYAVPVATDCINWYIAQRPNDVCALNIAGLLLERQKMYRSSAEKFSQALESTQDNEEKDLISINLARLCVQLGDYEKAIKLCADVNSPSFKSHCQLAIALFKAERYEESYSTYENVLEYLADTDSQKGHILCAMAAMAYMFEGIDAVKTLLFQCIEIEPRIVAGLLAAAALGVIHDDQNLSNLILKELESFRDDEEHRHHIALLGACASLKQNGMQAAVRSLTKVIRRHPGDARLWTHLVKFLSQSESEHTLTCSLKAIFLGRSTLELQISKLASISSYNKLKNDPSSGIREVLKMVHAFPGCVDNWAILIVALMSLNKSTDAQSYLKWIGKLTTILQQQMTCSQEMIQWLRKNEEHANLKLM